MVKDNKRLAMMPAAALAAGLLMSSGAQADQMTDRIFDNSQPSAAAMLLDTVVARPVLIVATVGGAAITLVSLPFSLLGGNTGEVAHAWIMTPGKAAFFRCLGCTPAQDDGQRE